MRESVLLPCQYCFLLTVLGCWLCHCPALAFMLTIRSSKPAAPSAAAAKKAAPAPVPVRKPMPAPVPVRKSTAKDDDDDDEDDEPKGGFFGLFGTRCVLSGTDRSRISYVSCVSS